MSRKDNSATHAMHGAVLRNVARASPYAKHNTPIFKIATKVPFIMLQWLDEMPSSLHHTANAILMHKACPRPIATS